MSARALVVLVVVAVGVYAIDQIAKYLVVAHLPLNEFVPVLGNVLQFFYVTNSGAAFSIGSAYTWIFSVLALAVLVFIIWFARRIRSIGWAVVFGLLLGGVLGNLTDRLFREPGFGVGHVVDFIKIPLLPAIFNLADTAICAAMVLFLIQTIRGVGLDGRKLARANAEVEAPVVAPSDEATDETPASAAPAAAETSAAETPVDKDDA
ncbi:signal peptidase II [Subtercola endophyticus]|uniref:signal peptidase II n=1 Tax=Subtercola endophyticus TaxID=2895559 RepID=UPI0028BE5FF6|nr:signal peptidase II [Subtercola endophyticus]